MDGPDKKKRKMSGAQFRAQKRQRERDKEAHSSRSILDFAG